VLFKPGMLEVLIGQAFGCSVTNFLWISPSLGYYMSAKSQLRILYVP